MSTVDISPNTENDGASKPITMRLNPDELAKAERYARLDHRTRASFLRVMMLRGLAAYEKELETTTA
jgi:hypothetical protein